jgi:hypothetical protein
MSLPVCCQQQMNHFSHPRAPLPILDCALTLRCHRLHLPDSSRLSLYKTRRPLPTTLSPHQDLPALLVQTTSSSNFNQLPASSSCNHTAHTILQCQRLVRLTPSRLSSPTYRSLAPYYYKYSAGDPKFPHHQLANSTQGEQLSTFCTQPNSDRRSGFQQNVSHYNTQITRTLQHVLS